MFCPQCRAEYRTGFTQCASCAVALVDELPIVVTPAGSGRELVRTALAFFMHQFVATMAVAFTAPLALAVLADFVRPFGWIISSKQMGQILTQTPYFPMQITLALFSGWTLARWLQHRSMLWVWILPFVALSIAFVNYPTYQPFVIGQFRYLSTSRSEEHT